MRDEPDWLWIWVGGRVSGIDGMMLIRASGRSESGNKRLFFVCQGYTAWVINMPCH